MTTVVRFSPALGDWIAQHLDQGQTPAELIGAMQERSMPPEAARAIVEAFVRARLGGTPVPVDAVELPAPESSDGADDATPTYRYQPSRLLSGTSIQTSDRTERIAARAERPILAVLNDVLSATECEELIEMARGRLTPSTVADPTTGRNVVTGWRTSFGMFFRPLENPFIARLDRRIAEIMNLPPEHGEGLQVLHYPTGAGSEPHFDFLVPSNAANQASIARSGQRVSTLVMYLNDVPSGGETSFPAAGWAVSPQRGNAVHFEYGNRFGELDHASVHASNAVQRGEKWVATKWMRAQPFISADSALVAATGIA